MKKNNTENNVKTQVKPTGQYVKGMSFEGYKSKQELAAITTKPKTELKLSIVKEKLVGDVHRTILQLEVIAKADENKLFKITLEYAGEFTIIGSFSEEAKEEILSVNCLTLLFPFARQVIAEICIKGGYPPVLLEPINFRNIYLEHKKKQEAQN